MKIQLISCDMSPNCTSRFNFLGIGLKGMSHLCIQNQSK